MIRYRDDDKLDIDGMLADGWAMKDIPWTPKPVVAKIFELMGEEEFLVLASTQRSDPEFFGYVRCQIMISPQGRSNLAEHRDEPLAVLDEWIKDHPEGSSIPSP